MLKGGFVPRLCIAIGVHMASPRPRCGGALIIIYVGEKPPVDFSLAGQWPASPIWTHHHKDHEDVADFPRGLVIISRTAGDSAAHVFLARQFSRQGSYITVLYDLKLESSEARSSAENLRRKGTEAGSRDLQQNQAIPSTENNLFLAKSDSH